MIDLRSARAKLDRAREYKRVILDEIALFGATNSYSITSEVNADATEYVYCLHDAGSVPLPGRGWALMIGDCLFNYRCALDAAVYAMGIAESGADPPPDDRYLMFPITYTAEMFNKLRWRLRSLCPTCRALIDDLQPYKRGAWTNPLTWLEDLHVSDKHRLLSVVFVAVASAQHRVEGVIPGTKVTVWHAIGVLKDGAPVLRLTFEAPNPDVEVDFDFDLGVQVSKGPALKAGSLTEELVSGIVGVVLDGIDAQVEDVINTIETGVNTVHQSIVH